MGDVIRYGFIALCILVLISVVVRWIVENWVFVAIGLFLVVLGILAFLKFRKPSSKKPAEIKEWSLDLLNKLEWKRFEEVVCQYYRLMGYRSEVTRMGADGGVDVVLYQQGAETPSIIIQCKSWSKKVGVKAIRELYGVMAADGVGYGIFATTSSYTNEAKVWADGKSMQLLSGNDLVTLFNNLPEEQLKTHLGNALKGEYSTPTCPSCNQKMVIRTASKGKSAGNSFWGCRNFPRCRQTFKIAV